jgi:hypothetical protein
MHIQQQFGNLVCRKSRTIILSNKDSRTEIGSPTVLSNLRAKSFTQSNSSFHNGMLKRETGTSKVFSSISTLRSAEVSQSRDQFRCYSSLSNDIHENLEAFEGFPSFFGIFLSFFQYFRIDQLVSFFSELFQTYARNPYSLRFQSIRRFLRKEKQSFVMSLGNLTNNSSFENEDLGVRPFYDTRISVKEPQNTEDQQFEDTENDENDYGFFTDFDDPSDNNNHLICSVGTIETYLNKLCTLNEAEEDE